MRVASHAGGEAYGLISLVVSFAMEVLEALEQLIGAAADHVHPDACALLKFPDNGSVDLLFMGGVDHQPLSLSGGTGKRLRLLCGAACQQGKEQGQNQNLFFHRHISAML